MIMCFGKKNWRDLPFNQLPITYCKIQFAKTWSRIGRTIHLKVVWFQAISTWIQESIISGDYFGEFTTNLCALLNQCSHEHHYTFIVVMVVTPWVFQSQVTQPRRCLQSPRKYFQEEQPHRKRIEYQHPRPHQKHLQIVHYSH